MTKYNRSPSSRKPNDCPCREDMKNKDTHNIIHRSTTFSNTSTTRGGGGSNKSKNQNTSLRDQFIKTNVDIFILGCFVAYTNGLITTISASATGEVDSFNAISNTTENDHDYNDLYDTQWPESTYAVLYPWFCQTIAIVIYYILSRYLTFLPYTAIVFILGFGIGYGTTNDPSSALGKSALLWLNIDGSVILLVFLPGLIFLDAATINVHLFFQTIWQLLVFAFPMVLAGTALTACVAKYVFPYNWGWNLSMTFGAILSSTDPIAVAGLLNALGAPPRLKMHISGESLLNDGSSMVFYNIFSNRFFFELEIPGFGKDIGWGEGFATFFHLSLGGVAIGLAFGLVTILLLKLLNRRLSGEENVIQVCALISLAYLTYYVADQLAICSGIIATIAFGLTIKVLGESLINDSVLTLHFFEVTGQLLNTLLFALGGTLWGNIISDQNALRGNQTSELFQPRDWGFLAALFLLLIVIRFLLVFSFYPLTSRLCIGTNIKESIFMSYGGFRGSVGIALALTLYNTLIEKTSYDDEAFTEYRKQVAELFCMVGGISLFTLLISGMSSKPLLHWLGLATCENVRHKVIDNYKKQMKVKALKTYVRLLSQDRFKGVEFSLIKEHVPFLRDITYDQLMVACEWYKNNTPQYMYQTPNLEHVIPYLYHSLPTTSPRRVEVHHPVPNSRVLTHRRASVCKLKDNYKWDNVFGSISSSTPDTIHDDEVDSEALHEARLNFIEILKSAYHRQIKLGELDSNGELVYSLFQSLEFCEDAAARGLPLNDWEGTKIASATRVLLVDEFFRRMLIKVRHMWKRRRGNMAGNDDKFFDTDAFKVWLLVRQALAFVRAHSLAQKEFEEHFCSMIPTSEEEKVIEESKLQCALAQADLDDIDREDVARIRGHKMCRIILNDAIKYIDELAHQELIPEKDAGETLDQLNEYIDYVTVCGKYDHDAKLDLAVQVDRLKLLPSTTLDEFKLWPVIDELSRRVEEEGERESETREVGSSLNSPLLDNVSSM